MRVLLVEDEEDFARLLARGLRESTYAVDVASDGVDALEKAAANLYDLVVLDVMLPCCSGLDVCRKLRQSGFTSPILMLTALDQPEHRVAGLDSGADDYLGKPFNFSELLARIRALLRRTPGLLAPVLTIGDLSIDTRTRGVSRSGSPVELTSKEYALLEYLARRAGEVVSREDISEHVWDETYDPFSNLIEVYIQRLRRKLGARLLHTHRGEGYRLVFEAGPAHV
ncbi:MAG: response regulator transcription factor [Acidobacteria bacterium]|nr:response regulator transcription factor [Acidobacteriota bacterium]